MRNRLAIAGLCLALILSALLSGTSQAVKISQPGGGGITCTGCSNNTLTKSNGTNLVNSSVTDNGTTVQVPNGTLLVGTATHTATISQINMNEDTNFGVSAINFDTVNSRPSLKASGSSLRVGDNNVSGNFTTFNENGMAIGSDNAVNSMSRMPLTFPIAAVAATTTTQWGEKPAGKALTIEQVTFNVGAFTCSVNPAISLFDCSATVGTCTPVSTLATSGTLTGIGSSNAATTPTANVAAGEYIAAEFTAGTCTVFNGSVEARARPQ